MRGGPIPRASMKLDNRPKKLLVKGVRDEGVQALRDWFEVRRLLLIIICSLSSNLSSFRRLAK
jgi:hypothetical protein